MRVAGYILAAVAGAASLYGLHLIALWAERRGWIYYRKNRGSSGTLSDAALELHSILEPAKRHVLEEKRRDRSEDTESGDPHCPGKRTPRVNREADDGP